MSLLSEPKGRFISLDPLCLVSGLPSFTMWFQSAGSKGRTCENSRTANAALLFSATGASRGARSGHAGATCRILHPDGEGGVGEKKSLTCSFTLVSQHQSLVVWSRAVAGVRLPRFQEAACKSLQKVGEEKTIRTRQDIT